MILDKDGEKKKKTSALAAPTPGQILQDMHEEHLDNDQQPTALPPAAVSALVAQQENYDTVRAGNHQQPGPQQTVGSSSSDGSEDEGDREEFEL